MSQEDQLNFTTLTAASTHEFVQQQADHVGQHHIGRRDSQDEDEDGDDGGGHEHQGDLGELREQDRFLPIANVARIMKKSIPSSQGKIAKDARECVQECVSEFISFITSEASDRCQAEKRKTINGEDILFAMSNLGFDNYVEPLKLYLQKYREAMKGDKGGAGAVGGIDGTPGDFDGLAEEVLASIPGQPGQAGGGGDQNSGVLLTYANTNQFV